MSPARAILSAALALNLVAIAPATASAEPSTEAPSVIPAVSQWTPGSGEFTLATDARIHIPKHKPRLRADAKRFAADLAETTGSRFRLVVGKQPAPGDIALRLNEDRDDLGAEGYELAATEVLSVTAARAAGAFYGTRTILQLLDDSRSTPRGSTVDVPEYSERGVGVCACYIHKSMDWLERLMKDMSYHKLNQLWIEAKVKSDDYPETAFWGYYTKGEVRKLSKLAEKYHIELIPEINSPGHMDPYLENYPNLQLKSADGERSPSRLDITRPEALEFYTGLLDEALEVWDTDYWHMGADEYMLGSDYANYPQIEKYAKETFGPEAGPDDVFVDFINKVNAHVKAGGRQTRIWNDGLLGKNSAVPLDSDVVVEHWSSQGVKPSRLVEQGNPVMNSAYALYLVRGGYTMDTEQLYDSQWTPLRFEGETLTERPDNLTGAKITMWPDFSGAETENEVEAKAYMPLRFIADATWGGPRTTGGYDEYVRLAEDLGHAPGWDNVDRSPLDDGEYTLTHDAAALAPVTDEAGAAAAFVEDSDATWTAASTDDGYYTLKSGRLCLDMTQGRDHNGVPIEAGAGLTADTCDPEVRTQRWQLKETDDGLILINALSQLPVTVGEGNKAVQMPPDQHEPAVLEADQR